MVNLDCFDIWKVETNIGQAYFKKIYIKFLIITSAVTPSQSFSSLLGMNISFVRVLSYMHVFCPSQYTGSYFKIQDPLIFNDFIKVLDILYRSQSWPPRRCDIQTVNSILRGVLAC